MAFRGCLRRRWEAEDPGQHAGLIGVAAASCPRRVIYRSGSLTCLITTRTIMVMAKRQVVTITDDIDGRAGAQTVSFTYAGRSYEIDLGERNRAKL